MDEDSGPDASSSPSRLAAERSTRGEYDHDRSDRDASTREDALLPTLDAGITLLDVEGGRGASVLQALVLDHLLLHDGPAFWVDADGHAATAALARIAPRRRLLDRIHVARGFTAYQHYGAIRALPTAAPQSIERPATVPGPSRRQPPGRDDGSSPRAPSLVVAPAVDTRYRAEDTLAEAHAETLQARTLARLAAAAEDDDIPVLLTRSERDDFTAPVATAADRHLECERTRMGPRFVGDAFETLVYPADDGTAYQTTLAYWRQLLGARATQVGLEPTAPQSSREHTAGVGTGVTVAGGTTTCRANPLLDAWIAGAEGR